MTDSNETRRRWRPSHGTVVGYVALFMALATGGAWAAATIGPKDIKDNAIHSRHIKKNAVKTKKIANDAVKTGKLADGAVTGGKVGTDTLTGDNIDESTLGQVPSANTANTASNANALGGVGPSGYQRSCTGGAIAGHVYVAGSAAFSAAYTSSSPGVKDGFNCTGANPAVRVKRVSAGTYYVDFPGLNQGVNNQLLVATGNVTVDPNGTQDNNDIVTYKFVLDNTINKTVFRVETADGAGNLQDREFSFTLMG
jgi:hypothetical protein